MDTCPCIQQCRGELIVEAGGDRGVLGAAGGKLKSPHSSARRGRDSASKGVPASPLRARMSGMHAGFAMQAAQRLDLSRTLMRGVVLEVGADHPQRTGLRFQHDLQRHALHALHRRIGRPGQQMAEHLQHRQPREHRVAELARGSRRLRSSRLPRRIPGCSRAARRTVPPSGPRRAAGQAGEMDCDFLQAQDVEVGERARSARDASRIHAAIDASAPLDVPSDQLHAANHARSRVARRFTDYPAKAQSEGAKNEPMVVQWHLVADRSLRLRALCG